MVEKRRSCLLIPALTCKEVRRARRNFKPTGSSRSRSGSRRSGSACSCTAGHISKGKASAVPLVLAARRTDPARIHGPRTRRSSARGLSRRPGRSLRADRTPVAILGAAKSQPVHSSYDATAPLSFGHAVPDRVLVSSLMSPSGHEISKPISRAESDLSQETEWQGGPLQSFKSS